MFRGPLYFVDDHEAGERLEDGHRLFEEGAGARILQVEVGGRRRIDDLSGKGRLAALARPCQYHHRPTFERGMQRV